MKLKKIASLVLAGVMAVSMLAGCSNDDGSSSNPTNPTEPVDNSFAASVNAELSDKYKEILTFGSDSALANVVNKIAASTEFNLNAPVTRMWDLNNAAVGATFRELMDVDNWFNGNVFQSSTEDQTIATLLVVDGSLTEKGLAKVVAAELEKYDDGSHLPLAYNATSKRYDYDYSGNMAVTKVTVMNGTQSYYVVGFTIAQDVTEVAA